MSITPITTVEEIAHPETEATVPARVDPDLIAGQEKNIETIASIGTIDHAHMIKNTTQTPETDKTHLTNNETTIDKDLEVNHLLEVIITTETAFQLEEDSNAKADQTVEITHFAQKLMLSI